MQIKTTDISKASLVMLIEFMRETGYVKEELMVELYCNDLKKQLSAIKGKLDKIDKKLKNTRLTINARAGLIRAYNKLAVLAEEKFKKLDGLNNADQCRLRQD